MYCHADSAASTLRHTVIHPSFSITTYPALKLTAVLEPLPDVFKVIKAGKHLFKHDAVYINNLENK